MSNVVRWNPFRELATMQSTMDRLFDEAWRDARPTFAGSTLPLDIYEDDNGVLTLTLPKAENARPRQIPIRTNVVSDES